jgi:hypothetical protein
MNKNEEILNKKIDEKLMTENNIEKMADIMRRLDEVDEKYGRKVKPNIEIETENKGNDIRALITLFDAFDQDKTIGEIKSTLVSFLELIK